MRVLQVSSKEILKKIMQEIGVDAGGAEIMLPKALNYAVKINSVSNLCANILKQEMLSLGGDVAISRDSLTGKCKNTDCLLIGSFAQITRLSNKLNKQPFGLKAVGEDLSRVLGDYQRDRFTFKAGKYVLNPGLKTYVMGIINLTPDSFSGDGLYASRVEKILNYAEQMIKDGADIIDVGGESSRPGAKPVSLKEELKRVMPVIKILAKKLKTPISVDTYKPEVARRALDGGAVIINDITGLRDIKMSRTAAKYKAGVVIMHMRGTPRSMQRAPKYASLFDEIITYLKEAARRARAAGVNKESILLDPGIGFGKTQEHNLEIINNLKELKILGMPVLIGVSRKSFIGGILKTNPQDRLPGTIAACVLAAKNGANIIRAHDVKAVKQALRVTDAIIYRAPNYVEANN